MLLVITVPPGNRTALCWLVRDRQRNTQSGSRSRSWACPLSAAEVRRRFAVFPTAPRLRHMYQGTSNPEPTDQHHDYDSESATCCDTSSELARGPRPINWNCGVTNHPSLPPLSCAEGDRELGGCVLGPPLLICVVNAAIHSLPSCSVVSFTWRSTAISYVGFLRHRGYKDPGRLDLLVV